MKGIICGVAHLGILTLIPTPCVCVCVCVCVSFSLLFFFLLPTPFYSVQLQHCVCVCVCMCVCGGVAVNPVEQLGEGGWEGSDYCLQVLS